VFGERTGEVGDKIRAPVNREIEHVGLDLISVDLNPWNVAKTLGEVTRVVVVLNKPLNVVPQCE